MIPPVLPADEVRALPDVVLADLGVNTTGTAPHDAYLHGHLPGAVFVDLARWLSAPPSDEAGRHPLPDPALFAEGMRRTGISESDVIVGYDRVGGVFAARLVWMLRAVGVDAALLDGGMTAWPGDLEAGEVRRPESDFVARPIPRDRIAEIDEVDRLAQNCAEGRSSGTVLLDAREADRYRGDPYPLDVASGHIPGAHSLPCREHLDSAGNLLSPEMLRERFASVGVDSPETPVISSCGSGVTACHNLLVMEHAGLGTGRLYPGSWSQWSTSDRPVAVGTDPCTPSTGRSTAER